MVFKSKKGKTVCLIGIRSDESFNRYIRIRNNFRKYKNNNYIYELKNGSFNAYLLYDWTVKDIWIANAKFGFEYNQLYDLFYYAGISIDKMRVASPFNDCASSTQNYIKLLTQISGEK